MTAHSSLSERVLPEFYFRSAVDVPDAIVTHGSSGGVVDCLNARMSMFIDASSPAVIRLTHSSGNGIYIHDQNLDKPKSSSTSKSKILNEERIADIPLGRLCSASKSRTDISFKKTDSHIRLLTSESNIRPVSNIIHRSEQSPFSDHNSTKPTSALSCEEETKSGNEYQNEQTSSKIVINNMGQKSASRKELAKAPKKLKKDFKKRRLGKKKKRCKSSRGSRNKTTSSKDVSTNKIKVPMATKIRNNEIVNDLMIHKVGVAGLGALETMCKPMVLHATQVKRTAHSSEGGKHENTNKTNLSKSSGNRPSTSVYTKHLSLPQMNNNLVKTDSSIRSSTGNENIQSSKSYVYPQTRVNHSEIARITKIYLSEKHSGTVKDCGTEIPCAPPATPLPDQTRKVEYIPSMNDIRSQRAVKVKLQVLEREAQKKSAKRREDLAKQEKQHQKEKEKDLKIKQRMEIYALNKIMTELENKRFKEFCEKKGISIV